MAVLSNSARLRQRVGLLVSDPLGISAYDFHDGISYVDYLVLLHTIVRASVPLMEEAANALGGMGQADPIAAVLRKYFEHHIDEEAGHDEWLLEDLATIGVDRSHALNHLPSPHVAAAVGAQYYWIRHYHPVALLGYVAVLEGHPPTPDRIRAWKERTGFPPTAFRTLEQHAAADPSHNRDLNGLIDSLPLSERQMTCICASALATLGSLALALGDLRADTKG